jgi:hypothetical protein
MSDCPPNGLARNRSKTPRIIAIGLEIRSIPFKTKYGINPCRRFNEARVSEAVSDATKTWKMVAANLRVSTPSRNGKW